MHWNPPAQDSEALNLIRTPCADPACRSECLLRTESCNPLPLSPTAPLVGGTASNLPAQPTPLLGRAEDILRARQALLRDDVRLLTLTGPAGVGKTRLALGVADCVLETFSDGVYLVELAPTEDPALVTAAIAAALGVREPRNHPLLPRLALLFRDRATLLVLDNFEHLLPAAAQLAALLSACPSIKILVTSRAALKLRWEHILRVAPLSLPSRQTDGDPVAAAAGSTAVDLFVERARAAVPGFKLSVDNASAISELCIRLDGLPLAIELAAARIELLSPKTMLALLGNRFELLVGGSSDLPDRQRTIRNALDYGFDLLPTDEQALFARLSLFTAGCTAEAATALDSDQRDSPLHAFRTLNRLDSLVHKSLLQHEPQTDGQVRFRMLETVRSYALERLAASGELQATRERWIEYHRELTQKACAALLGHAQGKWLEVLDREHDNLRAVLRWCVDSGDAVRGLELGGNLWRFWFARGFDTEGRQWLAEMLDLPLAGARTPVRAVALRASGDMAYSQGDYTSAEALQRESLAVYRELGDRRGVAAALDSLGRLMSQRGDAPGALAVLEESLALKRALDDAWGLAEVLHDLGDLASDQGQFPTARSRYDESLIQWHALGDVLSVAGVFESMAILAQRQGQSTRALRLAGASAALREQLLTSCCAPAQRLRMRQCLDGAQRALGLEVAAVTVEAGRSMRLEDAVTYARTVDAVQWVTRAPTVTTVASLPSSLQLGLTRREREVAAILLRGMSNRQIAEQLVITERTAETHVCRILGKLGLGSRAQLAALIMDEELAGRAVGGRRP